METRTPLKSWRISAGLSQQEAAERIGVSLPTWCRWENGDREVPATRVLDVERATNISRHALRPDVFGGEAA